MTVQYYSWYGMSSVDDLHLHIWYLLGALEHFVDVLRYLCTDVIGGEFGLSKPNQGTRPSWWWWRHDHCVPLDIWTNN